MAHTVESTAGIRTQTRAQIVALRLQGLTIATLVHTGLLTPEQAAALVCDAASYLPAETNDPVLQDLYAECLEQIAKDLQASRP